MGQRFSLQPMTAEDVARARQWLQAQPPPAVPSSRQILESIDPMAGPTRAREEKRSVDDHIRALLAETPPQRIQTPSGATINVPPQARMMGAGNALGALSSGVIGRLLDNPTDVAGALVEGMGRGAVGAFQDEPPTVNDELKQRGYDPGAVGGFVVNALTDPSNLIPSGAATKAVMAAAPLAGTATRSGGRKLASRLASAAADAVVTGADDVLDEAEEELAKGSAKWFSPELKARLDTFASGIRDQQRAEWIAAGKDSSKFGPRVAEIKTAVSNLIRNDISQGDAREAQRLIDGYFTTGLPTNYRGVNFDARRPVVDLLADDLDGGVRFDDTSKQRLALAFEQGTKRAEKEQWGDSRWLYHLSNGSPKIAAQISRLLGAFSPGQKTDANTLNAIEAFLRSMRGETVDDILGRKVPDPSRPGKQMRVGASLSTGHPRPGTVEANLQRAIQLGRIFGEKVEALAGAELGLHDDIPIDLWLMRAIGAQSDMTPGPGEYRLISQAMAKEAAAKNENPFTYMAKVWMGMQDIAGRPSPSFAESAAHVRLPGHLQSPGIADDVLGNMSYHGAGVKDRTLPAARSPIATNPALSFADWEREAQSLFREGKKTDVLGINKVIRNPKNITLAELRRKSANNELVSNMMRGAQRPNAVIGNIPLEAAPGAKGGARPGYRALSQAEQEKSDLALFRALRNKQGNVGMVDALFEGRTAPPIEGQGYWPTPQGVERNLLNTIPIELQTTSSGRQIEPTDLLKSLLLQKHMGVMLGQDAVPMTAVQFADVGQPQNVVRVWPSAGENIPRDGQTLSALLPAGKDWVMQHRDTSVDLFQPSGAALSKQEKVALSDAAQSVLPPEARRGAGSRLGRNIAGKASYVEPTWGSEGSRQATTDVVATLNKLMPRLSSREITRLDDESRAAAGKVYRILKKDANTSPALLNYLSVVKRDGVTGLKRALKDPNYAVPVLAALGVLPTLAPHLDESPDAR